MTIKIRSRRGESMKYLVLLTALLVSSNLLAAWNVIDSFYEVPKTSDKQTIQKALFNDANTRNYLISYDLTEFSKVKVLNYQMLIETVEWQNDENCTVESPVKITNMVIKVDVEFMLTGLEEVKNYNYQTNLRTPCNENYKVNI